MKIRFKHVAEKIIVFWQQSKIIEMNFVPTTGEQICAYANAIKAKSK